MATITKNFGANTALTVTNLHSLGDNAFWQSAVIDNGTIKGYLLEVFVTILTTTTAGDDDAIELYMAGSTDGGTDFAGGASGAEGAYTAVGNSDEQLQLLAKIPIDASEVTARTYKWRGEFTNIGEDFALLIKNLTGAALGATVNAVEYRLHKHDSV